MIKLRKIELQKVATKEATNVVFLPTITSKLGQFTLKRLKYPFQQCGWIFVY